MLADIALKAQNSSITLRIEVFVTCLCNPGAVPSIPNCEVIIERPRIAKLLDAFIDGSMDIETGKHGRADVDGLAMAVSGPRALTREAQKAVAGISVGRTRKIGNMVLHTEEFSL